jgi:hypothetical protein
MKRWSGRTLAAAFAAFCFAAGPARADLMPSFSYSWDQSPTTIAADGTSSGSISLSVGNGHGVAPTSLVAANLSVITSAAAPTVDTYTNKAYQLTLTLTDTASGQTGAFVFKGLLSGSANTTSSNFTNKFVGLTTVTDHIGNFDYLVHILPPVVPPIAGGVTQGGISATVSASPFDSGGNGHQGGQGGGGTLSSSPEPGTLLMACLGVPAVIGWRRLRTASRRCD